MICYPIKSLFLLPVLCTELCSTSDIWIRIKSWKILSWKGPTGIESNPWSCPDPPIIPPWASLGQVSKHTWSSGMNLGVSQLLTFIQNAFFSVTIPFSRSGSGCKDSWAGGEERFLLFFEGKIETEGEQRVDLGSWVNPRVSLSDVHAVFPFLPHNFCRLR